MLPLLTLVSCVFLRMSIKHFYVNIDVTPSSTLTVTRKGRDLKTADIQHMQLTGNTTCRMETHQLALDRWQHLLQAVMEDNLCKVQQVLVCYFPVDVDTVVQSCSSDMFKENPPLHQAVLTASDQVVNMLLDYKFDIHAKNRYRETPLHLASRKGREAIVRKLLANGADVNSCDCGDNTPLYNAVTYSHPHIAEILVQAGCDVDTLNEELMSPLDQALLYDQREIITILLKAGCSVDKTSGHVYYQDHYVNSVVTSLWRNGDIQNIIMLKKCGYPIRSSELQDLMRWTQTDMKIDITEGQQDLLESILRQPLSLKNCCRISIRNWLKQTHAAGFGKHCHTMEGLIGSLNLPPYLKQYVALQV